MDNKYVIGIDVGGTSVKIGFFSKEGELLDKWSVKTKSSYSKKELLEQVCLSINTYCKNENINIDNIVAAGMGVPGSVDENGIVTYAPNIGWKMYDAGREMSQLLNVPVRVENDANTAAFGELKCGSGKNKSSICFITLGTGVGGGIVVGDKIISGFNGCGGEIGHMTVNPHEKIPCNCGRYGCLEQYVSATGIARMAKEYMKENISAKEVFDRVKQGDSDAVLVADKFGRILGNALSNIACIFNPQIFVIGGGVSNAGEILIQYIQKYFVKSAYSDCVKSEFAIASLGNDAGIYGAYELALLL